MEKYTEKLAKLLFYGIVIALIGAVCYYFRSILMYLALSFVISLIARPLMNLMGKIKIRKKPLPSSIRALFSIVLILFLLTAVIGGMVPVVSRVVSDVSSVSSGSYISGISGPLGKINETLSDTFNLGSSFKIENVILEQTKNILNLNLFGSILGSVASMIASIAVGIFSVVFISFFLIMDDKMMLKIIARFTPSRHREKLGDTIKDCEHMLSRYFVGLLIEMTIVGLIDFIGLWAAARLDFQSALGIAFIAGILNIIPYLGPWIGAALGTIMGVIIKYCSSGTVGLDVSFWVFIGVLICVFLVGQLVDNYLLQPIIYSTSVKSSPLEIFLVMLVAGTAGGVVGMLICIPLYTVIRVVVHHFMPRFSAHHKPESITQES